MKQRLLLAIALFLFLSTSFSQARGYELTQVELDYTLNPDGTLDVKENLTYVLDGSFKELSLQKPIDLKISDASGYCQQKECRFFEQENQGWHELVLASSYSDETVNTIFEYTVHDQILLQPDHAQFFYKLWGEHWDEDVDELKVNIHLPDFYFADTDYFVHPVYGRISEEVWREDLTLISEWHPSNTYLELNLLMDKDHFHDLPQAKNRLSRQQIIDGELEYTKEQENNSTIVMIVGMLMAGIICLTMILTPLAFLIIYQLHGRETPLIKLGYEAIYEREPPKELTPSEANYLMNKSEDSRAITAEIMYLAAKGFLRFDTEQKKTFLGSKKELFITITDKQRTRLKEHQKALLKYLDKVDKDKRFSSTQLRDHGKTHQLHSEFFSPINKKFNKEYLDKNPNNIFLAVAIGSLLLSIVIQFLWTPFTFFIGLEIILMLSITSIILNSVYITAAVLITNARPQVLGKWTDEGRVLDQKCKNFKKYLNDFGSFEKKPVMDVILWEEYLAYAAGFGIAEKVLQQLKTRIPEVKIQNSNLNYYQGIYISSLYSASSSISTPPSSSGSGVSGFSSGGFGGGFGGGGGGGGAR